VSALSLHIESTDSDNSTCAFYVHVKSYQGLNVAYLYCNGMNLLIRDQLQEKGAAEALAFKVSGSSVGS